jgi:hypothetical protein
MKWYYLTADATKSISQQRSQHSSNRYFPAASIRIAVSLVFCCLLIGQAVAQRDSLVLKNGDVIVGELKSLDKGVVTVETGYSKDDFRIEWTGIKEIYSNSRFLITLSNSTRLNGSFRTSGTDGKIIIQTNDGQQLETTLEEIVYFKGLKSTFWSRVNAHIDLGVSFTKANNYRQFGVRSGFGYLADRWELRFFYDDIRSKQDSVAQTKRTEWGPSFKYFLPKDWFLAASLNFLSNTEQALDQRITAKGGAGKYVIHTNKAYLGLGGGLSYNNETFTNNTEPRTSLEGYVGVEANLFDVKDFSLLSSLYVYPSFTESGRWRTDFSFDTKYDLPLNLYIKLGLTLNYDNQPAVSGNDLDYVFMFSVGWEL